MNGTYARPTVCQGRENRSNEIGTWQVTTEGIGGVVSLNRSLTLNLFSYWIHRITLKAPSHKRLSRAATTGCGSSRCGSKPWLYYFDVYLHISLGNGGPYKKVQTPLIKYNCLFKAHSKYSSLYFTRCKYFENNCPDKCPKTENINFLQFTKNARAFTHITHSLFENMLIFYFNSIILSMLSCSEALKTMKKKN